MSNKLAVTDASAFVDAAVREKMLSSSAAKALIKRLAASNMSPQSFCINGGHLSPIQVDAINGLLDPTSVAKGFEILGLLGHGAIGVVFRARQPGLDRVVALKTIGTARLANSGSSTAISRFEQEAKAIAKLKHPNIVTAYDYGATDEHLYLAMEYVEGVDLQTYIEQTGQMTEGIAWQLARQVAAALAHAESLGIVHRDIKPANLLLTDPPAGYPLPVDVPLLKVTDFGLARLNPIDDDEESTRLTKVGATMGTPHYMAPEQIDSANVGFAADIYALGATVFHMLAGAPPYGSRSMIKVFSAKLAGEEPPIDSIVHASPATHALLRTMMATKPEDRPHSYEELLVRIADVLQDDSFETVVVAAPAEGAANRRDETPADVDESSSTATSKPARRLPVKGIAAAALAAVIGVGAMLFATAGNSGEPPPRAFTLTSQTIPLFNGIDVGVVWKGKVRTSVAGEPAGTLAFDQVERGITKERKQLPDSNHFGIEFQLTPAEAAWVAVHFDQTATGERHTLRVDPTSATLGMQSDASDYQAKTEPLALPDGDVAPVFRIERDATHWYAYQTNPEIRLIGTLPASGAPPDRIQFRSQGGEAFIGEVSLVGLEANQ